MASILRLSKDEQARTEQLSISLNKIRLATGTCAMTESQLLHEVLRLALPMVRADKSGAIVLAGSTMTPEREQLELLP